MLVHATCVAIGEHGILLRGPSGAGKSDLALRLLALAAPFAVVGDSSAHAVRLVADDQVRLDVNGVDVVATAPQPLRGLIEVRGLGILQVPCRENAAIRLVIDLVRATDVDRMPPEHDTASLLGIALPRRAVTAFEASAPLKCVLALHAATGGATRS